MKDGKRLDRNRLKGALADTMNVILSAAGINLHKTMKALTGAPRSLAHLLAWLLQLLRSHPATGAFAGAR